MSGNSNKTKMVIGIVIVIAALGAILVCKPWLQQRREIAALMEGIDDHEESTLRDAAQMEATFPDWKNAEQIDGQLKSALWGVSAGIDMYKKQVDTVNEQSGKDLKYSPRIVELEEAIADLKKKTQANKSMQATPNGAPDG